MRIPQTEPYIPEEDQKTVLEWHREILESGRLVNGKYTEMFEKEMAEQVGVRFAVALNSCTSALQAILEYIDVRGKNVLVPANTFIATANAVLHAGGSPVILEVGEDLLLDISELRKKRGQARALILVHLAGYIHPEIEEIKRFCDENDIVLIEDAAHAHGASLHGAKAGSFGLAGAFSFYASKVIATGAGGVVTTNDQALAERTRSLRFHGEDKTRGIQDRIGYDWLMTEFQAALGLVQLRRLPEMIEKRMAIAKRYDEAFEHLSPEVRIFPLPVGAKSGYYKYPVRLRSALIRDKVKAALEEVDIAIGGSYWPPIHLQPAYRERFGYKEGDFPNTERLLRETISLPLFPSMTEAEILTVVESLSSAVHQELSYFPETSRHIGNGIEDRPGV